MKNTAIVLAAGKGSRMKTDSPKQFLEIGGKPLVYYSLKAFDDSPEINQIILVTSAEYIEYCQEEIVGKYNLKKVNAVVAGGAERYHSVFNGLKAAGDCDYIFIHDGARPFVDEAIIQRGLSAAVKYKSAVAAMPVKDTIRITDAEGKVVSTPDRRTVWGMQTPQVFEYSLILKAYEAMIADPALQAGLTDDAMVVERVCDQPTYLYEGSYDNQKVTTPEDLVWASKLSEK